MAAEPFRLGVSQLPIEPIRPPERAPSITDKSTLKVHLPNGGFNVVKFGDATDIKVCRNIRATHRKTRSR